VHAFQLVIDVLVVAEHAVAEHDQVVVVHGVEGEVAADFVVEVDVHERNGLLLLETPEDELVVGRAGQSEQQFVVGLGKRDAGVLLALGFGSEVQVTFELLRVQVLNRTGGLVTHFSDGQLLAVVRHSHGRDLRGLLVRVVEGLLLFVCVVEQQVVARRLRY